VKTRITTHERLQLIGLLTLAAQHNAALTDIVLAVRAITGERDDMGHSADAVYSNYSVDDLLGRLEIAVEASQADPIVPRDTASERSEKSSQT
jgi:hypothetical protein